MDLWEIILLELKLKNLNTSTLTPSSLKNKDKLLPYLIKSFGEEIILEVLEKIKIIPIYNPNEQNDIVYSTDKVLINKIDPFTGEVIIFFQNPLSEASAHKAMLLKNEFKTGNHTLGFIDQTSLLAAGVGIDTKPTNQLPANNNNLDSMFKKMWNLAYLNDVSDIHISPRNENTVYIKFRMAGVITESNVNDINFANSEYEDFANRLLTQAGLNGGDFKGFSQGYFKVKVSGNNYLYVRLQKNYESFYKLNNEGIPSPSFVLRLSKNNIKAQGLNDIGLLPEQVKMFKAFGNLNQGLIIVSGPTGSAKTSTLYALLNEISKNSERMIQTIEDPVEGKIDGVKRISLERSVENDKPLFGPVLRQVLRSDVDVVLVGEIRDDETALGIVELVLSGHLVLCTVHARTTMSIITLMKSRLSSDSALSNEFIDSLSLVSSTRLVRQVCSNCAKKIKLVDHNRYAKYANLLNFERQEKEIFIANSTGCSKCKNGYLNKRLLVAEVFPVDNNFEKLIKTDRTNEVEQHAEKGGHPTIWRHGMRILFNMKTTIEELERTLPPHFDHGGSP